LLERARVALIGMRSTHATVRAAEMAAVSRKLNALAMAQGDEAKLGHEVATAAELTTLETQRADEAAAKKMEPIVEVATSVEKALAPVDDSIKN
jgi:hypothetical protein